MFYLQPEVEYLGAGENGDNSAVYGAITLVFLFILKHISLKQNQNFWSIRTRFGFLMNQSIKNPSKTIYNTDQFGKQQLLILLFLVV
jgi:hypothetical protein